MSGARFDIQFAGELLEDADPDAVRARLQELFKLSDEAAARMFAGKPLTIKRGVDMATASLFRKIFRDAGALVRVLPVGADASVAPPARESVVGTGSDAADEGGTEPPTLSLAPLGYPLPLEPEPAVEPRWIDISYLSLVQGDDWTLEDCAPPLPPLAIPDISHLSIIVPDDESEDEEGNERKDQF